MSRRLIHGDGPVPCRLMLVGEYCGYEEARAGYPFAGAAGAELDRCIERHGWYLTNLKKVFEPGKDGKPVAPTEEEIRETWGPVLEEEIDKVKPILIVAAGHHVARYFLGDWADMTLVHGLLFKDAGWPYAVLPVFNPAAGLQQPDRYLEPYRRDMAVVKQAVVGRVDAHEIPASFPGERYVDVDTVDDLTLAEQCLRGQIIAIDREGSVESPECFTASAGDDTGFLFRCDPLSIDTLNGIIRRARLVIFHNAIDDRQALANLGIAVPRLTDTMTMAAHLGEASQSLKVLAFRHHGRHMQDYSDLITPIDDRKVRGFLDSQYEYLRIRRRWKYAGLPKRALTSLKSVLTKPGQDSLRQRWSRSKFAGVVELPSEPTWRDVPSSVGVPYACVDAIETKKLYDSLKPLVAAQGRSAVAVGIDTRVLPFLQRMAHVGNAVDGDALQQLARIWDGEIASLTTQIEAKTGTPCNPLSPPQVSDLLYRRLRLRAPKRTRSGLHYSTEDKYLEARRAEHPVVPLIIRARLLSKMRGTYAERLPGLLSDGRYHQDPRPTVAKTGRLTEAVMLLVPKHTPEGKQIRTAFRSSEGRVLVSVDLSQIELRVAAHLSQDPALLDAYAQRIDLHAVTAHEVLGAPERREDQDESLHRLPSKTYNFAMIMGSTWIGIRDQLWEQGLASSWDEDKVRDSYDAWFETYSGFRKWTETQIVFARRHGYVDTLFGRRIFLPGIRCTNDQIRAKAERESYATVVQGSAADIAKRWIARAWKQVFTAYATYHRRRYLEPWAWIHDDITVEVSESYAADVAGRLSRCVPQDLCIPIESEAKVGTVWATMANIEES